MNVGFFDLRFILFAYGSSSQTVGHGQLVSHEEIFNGPQSYLELNQTRQVRLFCRNYN